MRRFRLAVLVAIVLAKGAVAGDMLTPALLVKQADAVAIVDNPLNSSIAVRRFIGDEPTAPVALASPLCVPDKDMLKRWSKTHPKHEGAPTWTKTLSVAHVDQIVFLKKNARGVLEPFCETEVMAARTFSSHPDYKATLAEVEQLVRGSAAAAAAAPVAEPAADPVAAPVAEAPIEAPPPAPVVDKGCG